MMVVFTLNEKFIFGMVAVGTIDIVLEFFVPITADVGTAFLVNSWQHVKLLFRIIAHHSYGVHCLEWAILGYKM